MHIGEKIRHFREEKKLKQDYVGPKIGLKQQEYSRLEAGEAVVSVDRLLLIAELFQVEPMEIINYDPDNPAPTFNSTNQQGGTANNYHYHAASEAEHMEKYSKLLSEVIDGKQALIVLQNRYLEEVAQHKAEIAALKGRATE